VYRGKNKDYEMFDLGAPELLIILLILVLLFGASRLPKLMRSVGESARELKAGFKDVEQVTGPEKPKTPTKKS
jgi:sec-independent protein translocase protein TatA